MEQELEQEEFINYNLEIWTEFESYQMISLLASETPFDEIAMVIVGMNI